MRTDSAVKLANEVCAAVMAVLDKKGMVSSIEFVHAVGCALCAACKATVEDESRPLFEQAVERYSAAFEQRGALRLALGEADELFVLASLSAGVREEISTLMGLSIVSKFKELNLKGQKNA